MALLEEDFGDMSPGQLAAPVNTVEVREHQKQHELPCSMLKPASQVANMG